MEAEQKAILEREKILVREKAIRNEKLTDLESHMARLEQQLQFPPFVSKEMLKLQSDNLPEEQQSKHTRQDEKHAEMEISTELLQQSSSKEALFVNEGADLKYEFGRTRFEVDGLEQKLNAPTITKEHNNEAAKQLAESSLKMYKGQDMQEIQCDEELKTQRSDTRIPGVLKTSQEFQNAAKPRQRMKRRVSFQLDTDVISSTKENGKMKTAVAHNPNRFLFCILLAVASLTAGFWLAWKIYL